MLASQRGLWRPRRTTTAPSPVLGGNPAVNQYPPSRPNVLRATASRFHALSRRLLYALALTAGLLTGCPEAQPDVEELGAGQSLKNEVTPVETLALRPRDYTDTFTITGLVSADEDLQIAAETSGRVTEVNFEQGDQVDKGDVLVRLDDDSVQAQIRRLRATIEREITQLEAARKDLTREESLFNEGVGSEKSFDDAESLVHMLEDQVTEARAALEEAQVLERKSTLRAPISGRIAERYVGVGEYVNPGSPIANLVKIDQVRLEFSLGERDVPRVAVGQELEFTIDAYPGLLLRAPIAHISPSGNEMTRTFSVILLVKNLEERPLLPGMSGKVNVVREVYENVFLVPEDAVLRSAEGAYLYLVKDGTAQPVGIDVVSSSGPLAVVRGVVDEGSECVILGQYALAPDAPVLVRRKYEEPPIVEFD